MDNRTFLLGLIRAIWEIMVTKPSSKAPGVSILKIHVSENISCLVPAPSPTSPMCTGRQGPPAVSLAPVCIIHPLSIISGLFGYRKESCFAACMPLTLESREPGCERTGSCNDLQGLNGPWFRNKPEKPNYACG